MTLMAHFVELAFDFEDHATLATLYGLLEPFSHMNLVLDMTRYNAGSVQGYLGILSSGLGRKDQARAHLETALDLEQRMRARPARIRVAYHLAQLLLQSDDRRDQERARALLDDAESENRELGLRNLPKPQS